MRFQARTVQFLFLLLLPLLVAFFGLGPWAALILVAVAMAWKWSLVLTGLRARPRSPVILETISASHFVEKVRWCLDRLGVDYQEQANAGTLGAFFAGRTVPKLHLHTGNVISTIGNSSDILRYLWGRYGVEASERAAFLEPVAEAVELEKQFDAYGVALQRWVYFHILPHRDVTLHAWGANDPNVPGWQRLVLRLLFPLLRIMIRRAFRINEQGKIRSDDQIVAVLQSVETRLADGRLTLLASDQPGFADFTFAAMSGLWLQPVGFGAGRADAVRMPMSEEPHTMRADVDAWKQRFPRCTELVTRLYRDERQPTE